MFRNVYVHQLCYLNRRTMKKPMSMAILYLAALLVLRTWEQDIILPSNDHIFTVINRRLYVEEFLRRKGCIHV